MRIRDSILIAADAGAIWPYVADPELQGNWNPKITAVDRVGSGPAVRGERFEVMYRMSGKDRLSRAEVTELEPQRRITTRHRTMAGHSVEIIEEIYELAPCDQGVRVVQTILVTQTAIPWFFRMIIWFVSTFGRPVGETYLEKLKEVVERGGRVGG